MQFKGKNISDMTIEELRETAATLDNQLKIDLDKRNSLQFKNKFPDGNAPGVSQLFLNLQTAVNTEIENRTNGNNSNV